MQPTKDGGSAISDAAVPLTARQIELVRLCAQGLSGKQIARKLGISARTVEAHFGRMLERTGTDSRIALVAYAAAAGILRNEFSMVSRSGGYRRSSQAAPAVSGSPNNESQNHALPPRFRDRPGRSEGFMSGSLIGYARVGPHGQGRQAQLDALIAADCREIVVETVDSRAVRPKLASTLAALRSGDTLVIHKPDRIARSVGELLGLVQDHLWQRNVNLQILEGACAGFHRPGQGAAGRMLFLLAEMTAEMERELIHEQAMEASAQQRRRGRPAVVGRELLAAAQARRALGEPVPAIARDLGIGRSTLYRALAQPQSGLLSQERSRVKGEISGIPDFGTKMASLSPSSFPPIRSGERMKNRKHALWLAGAAAAVMLATGAGTASAATISTSTPQTVTSHATLTAASAKLAPDEFVTYGPLDSFKTESQCLAAATEFPAGAIYEGYEIVTPYCEEGFGLPPLVGDDWWNLYVVVDDSSSCPGVAEAPAAAAPAVKESAC